MKVVKLISLAIQLAIILSPFYSNNSWSNVAIWEAFFCGGIFVGCFYAIFWAKSEAEKMASKPARKYRRFPAVNKPDIPDQQQFPEGSFSRLKDAPVAQEFNPTDDMGLQVLVQILGGGEIPEGLLEGLGMAPGQKGGRINSQNK